MLICIWRLSPAAAAGGEAVQASTIRKSAMRLTDVASGDVLLRAMSIGAAEMRPTRRRRGDGVRNSWQSSITFQRGDMYAHDSNVVAYHDLNKWR